MPVSIIVPTLNEEAHIVGTIRSLQRLSGEKEIIVVDGGSTDQTVPLACAQNVLVLEASRGRGLQMHVGALQSTGGVLWFLHADTIPPPDALEHIRKSLEKNSTVGGNFELLFDGLSRAARQLTAIYPLLRIFGLCAVLVRGFTELALALVPSRSPRQRVKSTLPAQRKDFAD